MLWYVAKSITFYDVTFINIKTNVVTPVREISDEYQLVVANPLGWAGEWLAVSICQCHRQFTIAITGTDRLLLMKERQYLSDLFEIAATVKRCVHCMRMVLSCCWVNQASAYPVPSVPLYVSQWTSLPWGRGQSVSIQTIISRVYTMRFQSGLLHNRKSVWENDSSSAQKNSVK